jgi:hypothetical protein
MKTRLVLLAVAFITIASADSDFGLVALAANENARVYALCDGSVAPNPATTDSNGTPSGTPCVVQIEFHDINGPTLKQSSLILPPGAGGFAEFTAPAPIEIDPSLDFTISDTRAADGPAQITPCFKVARGAAVGTLAIVDSATNLTLAHAYPGALVH